MKDMAAKLADTLAGCMNASEMQAVIDQHNQDLLEAEENFMRSKDNEKIELMDELREKREKKLNALRWQHEQLVRIFTLDICFEKN